MASPGFPSLADISSSLANGSNSEQQTDQSHHLDTVGYVYYLVKKLATVGRLEYSCLFDNVTNLIEIKIIVVWYIQHVVFDLMFVPQ